MFDIPNGMASRAARRLDGSLMPYGKKLERALHGVFATIAAVWIVLGLLMVVIRCSGPADAADLRLVIEEDQESGSFIYKTIDRRTGEVVLQLPRTDVLRMREDRSYSAGSVIRASA